MSQCLETNTEIGEVLEGHSCVLGAKHDGDHLAVTSDRRFISWSVDLAGRVSQRFVTRKELDEIVYKDRSRPSKAS